MEVLDYSYKKTELTLIMPVLNEGERIIPVISTLFVSTKVTLTLIVVYDSDKDTTLPIIDDLKKTFPNIVLVKNELSKLNGAIRTGFKYNVSDVVGIWLSYHVDPFGIVNSMYYLINEENCTIVSANRFNRIKRVSRGSVIKKLLSRTGNFVLNRTNGIPLGDVTTSIKLYKKNFIDSTSIDTTVAGGWALSTELVVKAAIAGEKLGDVEIGPENLNMIHGITNFKVFKQLGQYLKWLVLGFKFRKQIKKNYLNGNNVIIIR